MHSECASKSCPAPHPLNDSWTMYAHLPHETDWSLSSYKKISSLDNIESVITLAEFLPDKLIRNCMLFVMKEDIQPIWEDKRNLNGGCFSYKILNKHVKEAWTLLTYSLTANDLTNDSKLNTIINGITISPKKSFCIIKIWTDTCQYQDPNIIKPIKGHIVPQGCLFRKHNVN